MKRPEKFPIEHQAGGTVFRIHLAPLSRKQKDGTKKIYESFLVYYMEGPRRIPKRRSTWGDVEIYVEEVVAAHRKNDPERLELSGRDRRIYLAAVEAADPLGREVHQLVGDYAAVVEILAPFGLAPRVAAQMLANELTKLGNAPLSTAVDFYRTHGATIKAIKNVPDVVRELIQELRQNQRGDYHISDMESRLGRFADSFLGPIDEVYEREITGWLQHLVKVVWKDGKQVENDKGDLVSKRTRNNYRDAVCELFEFARKRGYVSRDLETEASRTVRLEPISGKNHIITPEEASMALEVLSPHLVPFAVVKLFSGLRTEEAYAMSWEELRIKAKAVIIEAELAKLGQRRAPPLQANAAKWLRPFCHLTGAMSPNYSSPQAVYKAIKREFANAGVALKRNTFRNCYISYRVAQPTASGIVADEAGTSKRMVEANYKALATKAEARKWFSISPSAGKLTELHEFAKNGKQRNPESQNV